MRLMLIGDIHACSGNMQSVRQLFEIIEAYMEKTRNTSHEPDAVVFMGDLIDKSSSIHVAVHSFLMSKILSLSVTTYTIILIGNHDRENPKDFQTSVHPFLGLSDRKKICIVDKAKEVVFSSPNDRSLRFRVVCVPYVEPGRFQEALDSMVPQFSNERPCAILCHQEFKGVNLGGGIKSVIGDEWGEGMPMVFSGHIHEHHMLKPNIMYVGTPYQITISEPYESKCILNVSFHPDREPEVERLALGIVNKMVKRLGVGDVQRFIDTHHKTITKRNIKIYLQGSGSEEVELEAQKKRLASEGFTNVEVRYAKLEARDTYAGKQVFDIVPELLARNPRALTLYNAIIAGL